MPSHLPRRCVPSAEPASIRRMTGVTHGRRTCFSFCTSVDSVSELNVLLSLQEAELIHNLRKASFAIPEPIAAFSKPS